MTSDVFGQKFLENWVENQNKMLDTWQKVFMPGEGSKEDKSKDSKDATNQGSQNIMDQWVEANRQFIKQNAAFFGGEAGQDLMDKMLDSTDTYLELNKFWKDLSNNITGNSTNEVADFYQKWQDQYKKMFSSNLTPFFPQPIQDYFKEPQELMQMYIETTNKFFSPIFEQSGDIQTLMVKSSLGDKEAYAQLLKKWREKYESTASRIFNMPQIGYSREYLEKQMESLDAFFKYINAISEFSAVLHKVSLSNFESLLKKYQEMVKEGKQPKTFKEFYDLWWTTNEDAYYNLFRTKDFSKLLSQVVDASVNFKKNHDTLIEEYLKNIPVPVKSEMQSLYKTVYDLKREVRNLKKELSQIKAEKQPKTDSDA
ncbi:class III poly(R)-hydroxyalkanoic acid synthase PhaE subunit [Desulfitispora alkaliphila]|uniref:poly(R)-hydroxyalkanoic acid synthase subunit PhaE n=1 Tax=Desulfitispora alkaliphila TaxID=622674 RepID=UPI003D1EE032